MNTLNLWMEFAAAAASLSLFVSYARWQNRKQSVCRRSAGRR